MPKVSETHRDSRRRQILDGARRAFARHGYAGATVPILEQEVRLSRGAIFSYYPSKLDLFAALAAVDRDRIGRLWLEQGFDAVVREVARSDPDWLAMYPEVVRMLHTDPELRERWDDLSGDVEAALLERTAGLQQNGTIRSDLPADVVLRFLGVVLDGVAAQQGAGFPIDVESTLELVRSALADRDR
jgi:TetR/AcrR family transcriptional regulator, transcriptional repressor of aconitase